MIPFDEAIGYLAGILTTLAILPQIVRTWRTKKVDDISPKMFIILTLGVGLWVIYGILKEAVPIIIFNGISFLLNFSMLALRLIYAKKKAS